MKRHDVKNILICVELRNVERDSRVTWAAELIETITAPMESNNPPLASVGIVADLEGCIEIGLVLLGRSAPRVIESIERKTSSAIMFPFRLEPLTADDADDSAWECLRELYDTGAVEIFGSQETQTQLVHGAEVALKNAMSYREWDEVVGRGESETSRQLIADWSKKRQRSSIAWPTHEGKLTERIDTLLGLLQSTEKDPWNEDRRAAVQDAVHFEALLVQLDLNE